MVKQYDIYWVTLNPIVGSEINKTRPAVIISPDASNKHLNTVIVAPLTSTIRNFPMRLTIVLERKKGQIALDQIRCIDKKRLSSKAGKVDKKAIPDLKNLIKEYLVD